MTGNRRPSSQDISTGSRRGIDEDRISLLLDGITGFQDFHTKLLTPSLSTQMGTYRDCFGCGQTVRRHLVLQLPFPHLTRNLVRGLQINLHTPMPDLPQRILHRRQRRLLPNSGPYPHALHPKQGKSTNSDSSAIGARTAVDAHGSSISQLQSVTWQEQLRVRLNSERDQLPASHLVTHIYTTHIYTIISEELWGRTRFGMGSLWNFGILLFWVCYMGAAS